MELTNYFHVSAPPQKAWELLTDVERIAPMLPGAQLQEIEGDEYRGIVKVKVGPITAQYKGTARFLERDEQAGKVVLKASGRDTRGQGNASAVITATMAPDEGGTKVSVTTDLTVTGKVAQFGRGVLSEVSTKLIGQFVDALEADLDGKPERTPAVATGAAKATGGANDTDARSSLFEQADHQVRVRYVEHPEPEPVDLVGTAGRSVARRLLPLLAVAAFAWVVLLRQARRRRAGA